MPVNSEVSKKREALEKRCAKVQQWREAARERAHRASVLGTKWWKQTKDHGEAIYIILNERLQALEAQGVTEGTYRGFAEEVVSRGGCRVGATVAARVSSPGEKSPGE